MPLSNTSYKIMHKKWKQAFLLFDRLSYVSINACNLIQIHAIKHLKEI